MSSKTERRNSKKRWLKAKRDKERSPIFVGSAEVLFKATAHGEGEESSRPSFDILVYAGGAMRPSFLFAPARVVVDLDTLTASEPVAVLLDHITDRIVGQTTNVSITKGKGGEVRVQGVVTGDVDDPNDPAHKVVMHAQNGFKWKASAGIEPGSYERVEAGTKVTVNGQTFDGPIFVLRHGSLEEVSVLGLGADKNASASIAATAAGDEIMDFHEWLKANGFDPSSIDDKQRNILLASFNAEQEGGEGGEGGGDGGDETSGGDSGSGDSGSESLKSKRLKASSLAELGSDNPFAHIKIEQARKSSLNAIAVRFAEQYPHLVDETQKMLAAAISEFTTKEMFELQVYRLKAEFAPNTSIHVSQEDAPEVQREVMEAGLALSGKLPNIDECYSDKILTAASKKWRHGLGLGEFLLTAGRANGYNGLTHRDVRGLLEAAYGGLGLRAAAPSTYDVSGILSNVANKFIVSYFNAVDSAWRSISKIRPVNDFKQITSYSLTGDFTYEQVAPGGEIKHGKLGEQSYTNQANTYGRMFAVDRRDIINDDLGAFTNISSRLGRGGALALNDAFWTLFMNNTSFFTAARNNFATGAGTDLDIASLAAAEVLFMNQTDPDGKPMALLPNVLLVPPALKRTALQIMNSTEVRHDHTAGGSAQKGTTNTFANDYSVASTPYLQNSSFTGNSATKYYLIGNPNDIATIEVAFLNGVESPTVESAAADFNTLGIQMRGFYDFGVAMQEYRAGVAMNGA